MPIHAPRYPPAQNRANHISTGPEICRSPQFALPINGDFAFSLLSALQKFRSIGSPRRGGSACTGSHAAPGTSRQRRLLSWARISRRLGGLGRRTPRVQARPADALALRLSENLRLQVEAALALGLVLLDHDAVGIGVGVLADAG